jgi:hypothetical protein
LVVIGALTVAVCLVAAGPAAAAKGGNSDSAKLCQKGTWKMLVPDAGGTFVNQGDCVNDGAQGNAPFGTAGKAACADIGGIFQLMTAPLSWSCIYRSPPIPSPELQAACATDAPQGQIFETVPFQSQPDLSIATCVQFGPAGRAACADIGGIFELNTDPPSWSCRYMVPPNPEHPPQLKAACTTEAPQGTFIDEQLESDLWVGICEAPAPITART